MRFFEFPIGCSSVTDRPRVEARPIGAKGQSLGVPVTYARSISDIDGSGSVYQPKGILFVRSSEGVSRDMIDSSFTRPSSIFPASDICYAATSVS